MFANLSTSYKVKPIKKIKIPQGKIIYNGWEPILKALEGLKPGKHINAAKSYIDRHFRIPVEVRWDNKKGLIFKFTNKTVLFTLDGVREDIEHEKLN